VHRRFLAFLEIVGRVAWRMTKRLALQRTIIPEKSGDLGAEGARKPVLPKSRNQSSLYTPFEKTPSFVFGSF
jgi:hypothetical protein